MVSEEEQCICGILSAGRISDLVMVVELMALVA